jgi:hypothetical protein
MSIENPVTVTANLIRALEFDNGSKFYPTNKQLADLLVAVKRMQAAGCKFNSDDLEQLAGGEVSEVEAAYSKYDGFVELSGVMDDIFGD